MSGGGGGDVTVGYRYNFGIHMGVCRGPVDELTEIRVGNKTAWTGAANSNGSFEIDAYDLFGGEEGEGGVKGTVSMLMGEDDQTATAPLISLYGTTDVPGYRGRFTMIYEGIVSMINPYPKPWKMRVRRILKGWDGPVLAPQFATISLDGSASASSTLGKCLSFTNTLRWGAHFVDESGVAPDTTGTRAEIAYEGHPDLNHVIGGIERTYECLFQLRTAPTQWDSDNWMARMTSRATLFGCWNQLSEDWDGLDNYEVSGGWTLDINNNLDQFVVSMNSSVYTAVTLSQPLRLRKFYHLAVNADMPGNRLRLQIYLNGLKIGEWVSPEEIQLRWNWLAPQFALRIGSRPDNVNPFDGWIDSFRVTNGFRYSTDFAPPTTTLPATLAGDPLFNNVLLLLNGDGEDGTSVVTDSSNYARVPSSVQNIVVDPNVPFEVVDSLAFDKTETQIRAMNPAHIIYECLTNRIWGRGLSRSFVDEASFTAAAQTLFNEGLGMCIRWTRSEQVMAFIQHVLDTIAANLVCDRRTGKIRIILLRGDYVYDSLPLFDEESGVLEIGEAKVASPADSVSEVVVNYRDPITDTDKKVRATNIAALQRSGGSINSQSRDYKGVPTPTLAMRLAQRELRAASISLRRFTLTLDRRGWDIYPGSVIRIRSLSRRIPEIAVRVAKIEEGSLLDGRIKITAVQDVFSLPRTTITKLQDEGWTPAETKPCVGVHEVFELPYILAMKGMTAAEFSAITPEASRLGVVCAVGQPMNTVYDLAVREAASTPDDVPVDGSYYCGYTP